MIAAQLEAKTSIVLEPRDVDVLVRLCARKCGDFDGHATQIPLFPVSLSCSVAALMLLLNWTNVAVLQGELDAVGLLRVVESALGPEFTGEIYDAVHGHVMRQILADYRAGIDLSPDTVAVAKIAERFEQMDRERGSGL